jgi:hypothetical protein
VDQAELHQAGPAGPTERGRSGGRVAHRIPPGPGLGLTDSATVAEPPGPSEPSGTAPSKAIPGAKGELG